MSTTSFPYYYGVQSEQYSFYRVPKILFTDSRFSSLSTDAKLLYGILLDRMSLSKKNGWYDAQDRVYIMFSLESVSEILGCKSEKIIKLFKELQEIGLIERKRQGLGKASLIYVKNFTGEQASRKPKP